MVHVLKKKKKLNTYFLFELKEIKFNHPNFSPKTVLFVFMRTCEPFCLFHRNADKIVGQHQAI